ncbi:hypothetical protein B0H14DRAFT_3430252 [Mycena olivaceomarginata]|nr:hypothetical protein B0H14DRAFT_3430252 [Mycena olivaceomarginata]
MLPTIASTHLLIAAIISIVDNLSLFARLAHLALAPTCIQHHHRASSVLTSSAHSVLHQSSSSSMHMNQSPSLL